MTENILRGITWGHSRGLMPLVAAGQRFSELHPGVNVEWTKRSLQEFADYPLERLTDTYDLLVIDHPWVGTASATGCVLPLDEYLPEAFLAEQAHASVGGSHASYFYKGHQWALAIDAATPAASYRADLMQAHGLPAPSLWEELLLLARDKRVAVPAIPIDLLMNFYTFCIAHGNTPFQHESEVTDRHTGVRTLESMRELYTLVDKRFFSCNPIAVAELMTATDDYWYCPFAYCYSNYSRRDYARRRLTYTDPVSFGHSGRLRTTVGGTGLAVSAHSGHRETALAFAQWVASPVCQRGIYVENGGQPGHRGAWTDPHANYLTHDFFTTLLPVMERGYIRPRYHGYLYFQDHAGLPLQEYLLQGGSAAAALDRINAFYHASLTRENSSHYHE